MYLVRLHYVALVEIHYKLPGQRLNRGALMTEHDARLAGKCPHFHHWVFHAGNQTHGAQRFKDHRGAHTLGAEVAHFFDLQEVKERIGIYCGQQTGFFPA
jgi:hypothetical protein